MVELAVQDSDWLIATGWEVSQLRFQMINDICLKILKRAKDKISLFSKKQSEKLEVYYVCGTDFVERASDLCFFRQPWCNGVIAIGRGDSFQRLKKKATRFYNTFHLLESPLEVDVSSTEIRSRVKQGVPINDLIHPSVAKYLVDNNISFN